MKITRNNMSLYRMEGTGSLRPDSRIHSGSKAGGNGNYDEITIQSSSRQIQEKTFSAALSKRVVSDAGQGAPSERVAAVKQQVEAGTYQVDPYAVASRMLLTGEAFAHA